MAKTYTLNVAGLTRELTICKVNDHMDIAAFIMLGDAELTVAAATELLKKCPEFDILLTAEAKGIPLAHEMSRQSGKPYVCARKGEKLYMTDPVVVEDQSITTAGKQKLVIDRKELDKMSGKRVLVPAYCTRMRSSRFAVCSTDAIPTAAPSRMQSAALRAASKMHSTRQTATKNAANGTKSSVCGKKTHTNSTPSIPAQKTQSGRRIAA